MKRIYLDHAASTPVRSEVIEAMQPYWAENFGNASSLHTEGKTAKAALTKARQTMAQILTAKPEEIIFTGSGTESVNLAILGFATNYAMTTGKHGHIITSAVEHHAVLNTCRALEKFGFAVTFLPVDRHGAVGAQALKEAMRPDTILVSLMYANNEVGTVHDLKALAKIIKKQNPQTVFHTDACQAPGLLPLDVQKLGVDMLSLSAQKFYGPKGVGALFVKKDIKLAAMIHGGGQEKGLRSGTENIAGIVGMATALRLAEAEREEEVKRLTALRDYFIAELSKIPQVTINGDRQNRLANNINITVAGVEGETVVIYLDKKGVAASTGAACSTAKVEPSHVLLAMGESEAEAKGALRFTLGKSTQKEELDTTVQILRDTLNLLCQ